MKSEAENICDKYDEYGVSKNEPWIDIQKGDIVEYIDTKLIFDKSAKKKRRIKETLIDIWDGEKVSFNDSEKTIVRTTRWLKKHL